MDLKKIQTFGPLDDPDADPDAQVAESEEQVPELPTSGQLEIHVVEAELDRNVDTFKKQDPYAVFEVAD